MVLSPDAALLAALRRSPTPLLPGELGRELGVSPAELSARIDALCAAGFEIERHPTLGCSLRASPDRLIGDDLAARLAVSGGPPVEWLREFVVLAETGSTNDVAMRLGRDGVPSGVLVMAESQTAGRGRFGRRWESAPGRGIWMSLLWQPPLPLEEWTRLTTWVGVAVAGAIERTSGHRAAIKWPNDVQIEGRKAAGILIELGSAAATQAHFAVIGIGINANHELEDFPAELREIATSIRLARGETVDRPDFVVELIRELERWRPCLAGEGFGELVAEAARRSAILGRRIEAQTPEGLAEGIAESLDDDGCLVLRTAEGGRRKLVAGEVTLRRG